MDPNNPTAREVDPVDLDEEHNPDEDVWNDFAQQVEAGADAPAVAAPTEEPVEPAPEPEESSAAAPETPPAEEPAPPPPAPEPVAVEEPEAPPAEPETPAPQFVSGQVPASPAPVLTDEQRRERIVGLRKAAMDEAERLYALDEEAGNEYLENPAKVLPKLAARVQLTTQEVVVNEVMRMLPAMVNMELERRQSTDSFWNEFESEWPKLKGRKGELERMAVTYQAMNPRINREDLIRNVGASAMLAFRIPVEVADPTPADPSPQPPPRPVTGARPASPAPKLGMFEQYAAELEQDDD